MPTEPWDDELLNRAEVAEILALEPDYVRKFLTRRGVSEQRGYRRGDIEPLIGYARQQGRRTDLERSMVAAEPDDGYRPPTQLASDITDKLRADHKDCRAYEFGGCQLAHLTTDDVQEILNLATELQGDSRATP